MKFKKVRTIIAGGQTGADRAALDFALDNEIGIAGFVPRGRRAEDGRISAIYENLTETKTRNYAERTELNVRHSDATLILSHGKLTGGSRLTAELAKKHDKPLRHVDFQEQSLEKAAAAARKWLVLIDCRRLNVAGPRASTDPAIYEKTKLFLTLLFEA